MFRFLPALFLLLWMACPAPAAIYKCTDGKDHIAYQASPCAAHLHSRVMPLKAAPPPSERSADSGGNDSSDGPRNGAAADSRKAPPQTRQRTTPGRRPARARQQLSTDATDLSWQCRVANGEVFYQHSPCPDRVSAVSESRDSATRGRRASAAAATAVSARTLPRREACRRIHAASASDRAGHERDEDVDTYERNLGRDPCR